MTDEPQYEGIAIIGMAGRFPGAENVEEFWANLLAGRESVSFFSDAELAAAGFDPDELKRRGHYVPARGVLKDADCFDAAFFGVNPKEAEVMDPQHRVFLESCWEALERAGYAPNKMNGSGSIFAGASTNTYVPYVLEPRPELMELVGSDLVTYGNDKDYLTTRVAYKLGLKGPALNVATACSTALVAVGQAVSRCSRINAMWLWLAGCQFVCRNSAAITTTKEILVRRMDTRAHLMRAVKARFSATVWAWWS